MGVTNQGSMNIYVPQGAIKFDGKSGGGEGGAYGSIECTGDSVVLNPTKSMGVATWLKISQVAHKTSYPINRRHYITHRICYNITIGTDGKISFVTNVSSNTWGVWKAKTVTTNNSYSPSDNWLHVIGVYDYDNEIQSIYINGELENSISKSGSIHYHTSEDTLFIGGFDATPEYSGNMCDIKFWSGNALTASEAKQVYNGIDVTDGLVAHWKFDDKEGTTLADSKNDNDITLAGTPGPIWVDRDIRCWGTRWTEGNWDVVCETFVDTCDRNYLFDNVTPGAQRELYNILGTPYYKDTTFTSSNTLIYEPIHGYGLSSLREKHSIVVKSISDTFINKDVFGIKIEGNRLDT